MAFRRFCYLPWEWIVDYYHACLYLTKLAEAIFGRGRQAFAWAAKRRRVLKQKRGGVFRVLRSVGALLAIRGLVGSEDAYFKAYRLLRDRTEKMDCVSYRRLRLPIGSGVTEAACKIVFTQRFKQPGMKWTIQPSFLLSFFPHISSRFFSNIARLRMGEVVSDRGCRGG
jgi:hypothetical protein